MRMLQSNCQVKSIVEPLLQLLELYPLLTTGPKKYIYKRGLAKK